MGLLSFDGLLLMWWLTAAAWGCYLIQLEPGLPRIQWAHDHSPFANILYGYTPGAHFPRFFGG